MFCPYCGTKSQAPGAMFCASCGRALAGDDRQPVSFLKPAGATALPKAALWKGLPFWLFVVAMVGCAAAFVFSAMAFDRPAGHPEISVMIVMAAWFAFLWRRQGRNLWSGLLIGLAVGFTIGILARATAATYARAAEHREIAKTLPPIPPGFELIPDPSDRLPSRLLEYPQERQAVRPGTPDDPLGLDPPARSTPSITR